MTLPGISVPAQLPAILAEGHAVQESSPYAQVAFAVGHGRARRVRTAVERVVPVSWFLNASQLAVFDDWFEDTLLAGSRAFSVQVAAQGAGWVAWWEARWVSPPEVQMLNSGWALVSGSVFLTGEPSATPPDTGALASEGLLALVCIPANPTVGAALASEGTLALRAALLLRSEGTLALTATYEADALLLEGGDDLLLESGDRILLE